MLCPMCSPSSFTISRCMPRDSNAQSMPRAIMPVWFDTKISTSSGRRTRAWAYSGNLAIMRPVQLLAGLGPPGRSSSPCPLRKPRVQPSARNLHGVAFALALTALVAAASGIRLRQRSHLQFTAPY